MFLSDDALAAAAGVECALTEDRVLACACVCVAH